MGIEPTRDSYEPHTDFEDQGHHQEPVTSTLSHQRLISLGLLLSTAKGPALSWTNTWNLPDTSDGTRHEYRQVKPHPYSKLPWCTALPSLSLTTNSGLGGRDLLM